MRTSQNVLSKTEPVTDRAPAGCRAMHFFMKLGPFACRLHPVGAHVVPMQLVERRLATSNFMYLPGNVRAPLYM